MCGLMNDPHFLLLFGGFIYGCILLLNKKFVKHHAIFCL